MSKSKRGLVSEASSFVSFPTDGPRWIHTRILSLLTRVFFRTATWTSACNKRAKKLKKIFFRFQKKRAKSNRVLEGCETSQVWTKISVIQGTFLRNGKTFIDIYTGECQLLRRKTNAFSILKN